MGVLGFVSFCLVLTMTARQQQEGRKIPPGEDPSSVWKSRDVANTFADIRDSIPMAKEQLDVMTRVIRTFRQPEPRRWLDLGCGSGPLSRKLLHDFPLSRGIMLDYSEPMLQNAQSKLQKLKVEDRVKLVQADLSRSDWKSSVEMSSSFDVVVSGFAIHHLSDERKKEVYQEVHDILSPGGVFLNLEHVASPDPVVERIFDGAFVDSMYQHYQGQKSEEECQAAVEYDLSVDEEANILTPVETQCDWLRNIGYDHVDCYFKFFILALFGGVKKGEE
jgi:tRNA (cmo5U34)-methyltransferase